MRPVLKKKWLKEWSSAQYKYEVVSSDENNLFSPLSGKALSLWLARADHFGSAIKYKFSERKKHEPEELFFRYYLRFGDNWNQSVSEGKLPGFLGTYGKAGWGGEEAKRI